MPRCSKEMSRFARGRRSRYVGSSIFNASFTEGLLQLIMSSNNPHTVAYIFRDYARAIHKKAVPADPNYLRICVVCGKVRPYLPSVSWPTCSFLSQCTDPLRRVDRTMGRTPLSILRLTHRYRWCHSQTLRSTKPNSPTRAYARI